MSSFTINIGTPAPSVPALPTTNLSMLFYADTGVTTSGATVTGWADQSGNGLNGVDATAPPTLATDYAARPVVRFAAGQQFSFGTSSVLDAEGFSAFLVCQHRGGALWLRNYAGGGAVMRNPGSPDGFYLYGLRDTGHKFRYTPSLYGIKSYGTSEGYTEYETATGLSPLLSDANCDGILLIDGMDVYAMAVYDGAGPAIADVRAHFNAKYSLRSTAHAKHMLFIGDSITAGYGIGGHEAYPSQVLRSSTADWRMTNRGDSGATVANLVSAASVTDSYKIASIARNVLTVMIGRNDAVSDSGSTIYTNLVSYVQARVSAGWEVWVGTAIATSNPTMQGRIDDLNARIRGTTGAGIVADAGANRVIDYGGLAAFNELADASSGDYQGDGTHPSAAGALKMADLIAPAMAA